MEYSLLPSSAALYPHLSESKDARRTWLKGDFWIRRIDACKLVRQLSDNDYRVTKVAHNDVAPFKRGKPRLPRPQQGRHWPEILFEPSLLVLNFSPYVGLKVVLRLDLRNLRFVTREKRFILLGESRKNFSLSGGLPGRSLNQTAQNCRSRATHEARLRSS